MSFDPKKFAKNLKNSTLSQKSQEALLDLLPSLTNEQIDEIALILEKDNGNQENLLKQLQLKADIVQKQALEDLEKTAKRNTV